MRYRVATDRRTFLSTMAAGVAAALLPPPAEAATLSRPVPKTLEPIPIIGMGSWITLNVGSSARLRADRLNVVQTF